MSESPSYRRTLPAGGVLWWQGDPATSLAVVENGCLGVRAEGRLLDVSLPGTVLGEAALLAEGAAPGRRTADVVVLEPESVIVEYPVAALRASQAPGVPATVLRTLFYQVARNVTLVRAARRGDALIAAGAFGIADAAARAHRLSGAVSSWDDFVSAFRFAYRLRECSDVMRAELAPAGSWTAEEARAELDVLRGEGFVAELATAVEGFIALWSSRPEGRT